MTETNAERLERLENMVDAIDGGFTAQVYGGELDGESIIKDFCWLIEQAELQQKCGIAYDELVHEHDLLYKENKRLQDALEFYADQNNYTQGFLRQAVLLDDGRTAEKALEVRK